LAALLVTLIGLGLAFFAAISRRAQRRLPTP